MKPALTAEEWKTKQVDDAADGPSLINEHGELLIGYDAGHGLVGIERPHAIAALALYGQPFGFTREDVQYVRFIASLPKLGGPDVLGNSLADRIEALLPSENGWTVIKPAESASGSSGGDFSATSPTEDQAK